MREAGATYDDLQVTVAVNRDSATPFTSQLQRAAQFQRQRWHDTNASGSFVMQYIGARPMAGRAGRNPVHRAVGSKDKINLPFVNDPQVMGEWKSVDFVAVDSRVQP